MGPGEPCDKGGGTAGEQGDLDDMSASDNRHMMARPLPSSQLSPLNGNLTQASASLDAEVAESASAALARDLDNHMPSEGTGLAEEAPEVASDICKRG